MKKITKYIYVLVLLFLIAFITFKVYESLQNKNESTDTIKVGVLLPLSGPIVQSGELIKDGIELAKEKAGKSKIELIYEDTQCDPKKAVSAFNKLVELNKVKVVIGLICSGEAIAVAPLAEEKGVVILDPLGSSPELTNISKNFFRIYPSDQKDSDLISEYIAQNNFHNVGIISINNEYGEAIHKSLTKNLGNRISINEKFNYGNKDFRTFLIKAKATDAVILIGYEDTTVTFLQQKDELGMKQLVIGSSATFTAKLLTQTKLNSSFLFSSPDMQPEGRDSFSSLFKNKYKRDSAYPSEYGYDTYITLNTVLKNIDTYDESSIRQSLVGSEVSGATGLISFDGNHDRKILPMKLYQINLENNIICKFNCK